MKNLSTFLVESVGTAFIKELKNAMSSSIVKKFTPYGGEQDPNKYEAQDNNAKSVCDAINASGKYKAVTVKEFYEMTTGKNPDNLSAAEWARFDRENGDIIFVDDNNKPLCKVDLKVSSDWLGAVSLGSIIDFDKNGLYACCCITTGEVKIVSHSDVEKLAKSGILSSPHSAKSYQGKPVKWNGQDCTTEYFVKGRDIKDKL